MEVFAKHNYARSSAQKLRLIVKLIKGKNVIQAINILKFNNKKAAFLIKKVLESAISNAENNNGMDIDNLIVKNIIINEGSYMKRIMPRAKGKADKIIKRTSHIILSVSDT